jgi:hypothetical protein
MDDAKKEKTRRESTPVKVWVTPAEKAAIAEKAAAHSMSASRYLRALGLALPIQSTIDHRAVLDLLKINADRAGSADSLKCGSAATTLGNRVAARPWSGNWTERSRRFGHSKRN